MMEKADIQTAEATWKSILPSRRIRCAAGGFVRSTGNHDYVYPGR